MVPVSMVGRADELSELVRAWSRAARVATATRRAGTVVITGEAGVGKTLLVTSGLDLMTPRPRVVLSGTARMHAPAPYDWLAAVLSGRDTAGIPVPPGALAWLAQDPDAPAERYTPAALLRLAVATVRALVGPGPAVLVVEDLHALDPASLNLIGELATVPDLPALVLVTSRPSDSAVSPQLAARTVARLASVPGAVRQHLGPLPVAGIGAIMAQVYPDSPPSDEVVRTVWERTGGNPYWVMELLVAAGSTGPDALARLPLPGHLLLNDNPAGDRSTTDHHVRTKRDRTNTKRTDTSRTNTTSTDISRTDGDRADADRMDADRSTMAQPAPAAPSLTSREIDVLNCLAEGMSNKQVARSLGISIRTVTVHVSNLLRKTQSASRTEAALWAVQNRLTAPGQRT